ncbi:MAG: hypothetical protein HKN72_09600 [Gemmatimonadetes bacterium]|nr:hypothetical protein [Gemmatimonadota bacterium]
MEPSEGFGALSAPPTAEGRAGGTTAREMPVSRDVVTIPEGELRRLYADYRLRQARSLLSLMPREAVRPLYRRAHGARAAASDPMDVILSFVERLMPLPTYDVWLADFRRHPEAHWEDLEGSADVPSPSMPATLDTRRVRISARGWNVHLRGFRDDEIWRGFIAFEDVGVVPSTVHRTALIFREDSLEDLRARFREFESASLEAFFRSALS